MTDADNKRTTARLVEGPVGKILATQAAYMLFGMLGMVAFNLVDTWFIAKLGILPLAAVSMTFPVVFIVGGIAMGIGGGASVVVSRAVGSGDRDRIRRLATDALFLGLLIVGIVVVIGYLTINPVFRAMSADEKVLPLVRDYMKIWYAGVIFVVIPMIGNNVIRAVGDARAPSIIMLCAVLVNMIMDPLLIFGIGPFPRLELVGAAAATVGARATALVASLYVLIWREKLLTLAIPSRAELMASWKEILYIGLPTGLTNIILPTGIGILTAIVATYGPEAVAALGVGSRIEMLVMSIIFSLGAIFSPFIGQNWGARRLDRVREGVKKSFGFAIVWGLFLIALLWSIGEYLAGLFTSEVTVVSATSSYLQFVSIGFGAHGVMFLSNAALNALRRPLHASVLMLGYVFVFLVPLAMLGSLWYGLTGVFVAAMVARLICGLIAGWLTFQTVRLREAENQE